MWESRGDNQIINATTTHTQKTEHPSSVENNVRVYKPKPSQTDAMTGSPKDAGLL